MARLIVFISGNGSNLQALIDAIGNHHLQAQIVLVVSNRKAAYGLERARLAHIPTCYFPLKPYSEQSLPREQYDADLAKMILPYQPNLIVLAGWMHILSRAFLDHFPNQVVNLHPALPGQFLGTDAIARAFAAYRAGEIQESGCMVHYVIPKVDAGPVIAFSKVPIYSQDTLETFSARMHEAEHRLIVDAVRRCITP